jgi:hypothetical protein
MYQEWRRNEAGMKQATRGKGKALSSRDAPLSINNNYGVISLAYVTFNLLSVTIVSIIQVRKNRKNRMSDDIPYS